MPIAHCPLPIAALVALLLAAVLTPEIPLRDGLPAVRIEQVLALAAAVWLVRAWWAAGRPRRPGVVDLAFLSLGGAMLASTLAAPLLLGSDFSARDLYEPLKLGLYWVLFRSGVLAARDSGEAAAGWSLRAVLAAGVVAALFALAQYYDVFGINARVTGVWAPAHHLRTLALDARAVGTAGNANYFGLLAAVVLLAATAWLLTGAGGRDRLLCLAGLAAGATGLVTSGSRSALLAWVAGTAVLLFVSLLGRRLPARQALAASGGAVAAVLLAVLLVEAAPRGRESYLARLAGLAGGSDSSVALRLERWRGALPWGKRDTEAATPADAPLTYLFNGSLEVGSGGASDFRTLAGTRYEIVEGDAIDGRRAALFRGNPATPSARAALFQQRYLGRGDGGLLTAAVWVKLTAAVSGDLSLWVNLYYADGGRSDPHARVPADTSRRGEWQQLVAPVRPEAGRTVTFVGVYLMGEAFEGEALVDGFQLVDGDRPQAIAALREAPPGAAGVDTAAILERSPLLGGGPGKATETGAVDNEYLTVLARYGLLGLALYAALWLATGWTAWRGLRRTRAAAPAALGLTLLATIGGFLVFNLAAGSLFHLQLMGVFWPLAGVGAALRDR